MIKKFWMMGIAIGLVAATGAECRAEVAAIDESQAYRQTVKQKLLAEIKQNNDIIHRAPGSYGKNLYFKTGSGSLFDLEPVGPSVGDVVGA
jgi:hypothetical protein